MREIGDRITAKSDEHLFISRCSCELTIYRSDSRLHLTETQVSILCHRIRKIRYKHS